MSLEHFQTIPAELEPLAGILTDPRNPNVMPQDRFTRLREHIGKTGKYPALIYRVLPPSSAFYDPAREGIQRMLIDGHHRRTALSDAGYEQAYMQNWGVMSDDDALLYMDVLNYNKGEPDARQRAENLHALSVSKPLDVIAAIVPLSVAQVQSHLDMRQELIAPPPLPTVKPENCEGEKEVPVPVRFVLYPEQKKAVDMALAHAEGTLTGNNKKGQALEMMARDYLSGVSPDELSALEARFADLMGNPMRGDDE